MIPLLSIAMPVYNVEKFLKKSISSVLQQEIKNFELIMVDDGSTDSSGMICDTYAKKDSRIRVVHKSNGGVVSARKTALKLSKGEYITFLDPDDWIDSSGYKKLIDYMKYYDADIGIGGYLLDYGYKTKKEFNTNSNMVLNKEKALTEILKGKLFSWSLCDKIYKREIITNTHVGEQIICGEDLVMNYFAFKKANVIVYKPVYAYHYVQRNGSATKNTIKSISQLPICAINYIEQRDTEMLGCIYKQFFYAKYKIVVNSVKLMTLSDLDKFYKEIITLQKYIRTHLHQILFKSVIPFRTKLGAIFYSLPFKICILLLFCVKKDEKRKYKNYI